MTSNKLELLQVMNSTLTDYRKKVMTTSKKSLSLFPDFYDYNSADEPMNNSSNLFGLFPSDYDTTSNNESYFLGFKSEPTSSSMSQLSVPIVYILCMLALYFFIIAVAFFSALYSHRKQVGYNYDDNTDCNQSDDSGSEENQLLGPNKSVQMEVVCEENELSFSDSVLADESFSNDSSNCSSNSQFNCEEIKQDLNISKRHTQLEQFQQITKKVKTNRRHKKTKRRKTKKLHKIYQDAMANYFLQKLIKFFPAASCNVDDVSSYSNMWKTNGTEMKIIKKSENDGQEGPYIHVNNSS